MSVSVSVSHRLVAALVFAAIPPHAVQAQDAVPAAAAVAPAVAAGDAGPAVVQSVVISAQGAGDVGRIGAADSASEGTITHEELAERPLLRPAEVLEAIPGLTVTQHSGDGKANQYFLRGFNLDHGSDFAGTLVDMPVNLPTHAHGQGYMDLNLLIPELVDNVQFHKGVYSAADGDFATTGSARIDYARTIAPFALATAGPNDFKRLLAAGSRALGEGGDGGLQLLGAAELETNDGPWVQPETLRKRNAVLRLSSGSAADGFALTALAYDADWRATEEVPERAIDDGEISRFGYLTPDDGGRTHRYALTGAWARSGDASSSRVSAFAVDYGLDLFSNPSGFITGPQGDQHEQLDERHVWGGEGAQTWHLGEDMSGNEFTLGAQFRQDRIPQVGLFETVLRQRTSVVRDDRVFETEAAAYAELRTAWRPWLRSTVGLRWDGLDGHATPLAGQFDMANGGAARAHLWSPKFSVAIGPFGTTEFYADAGSGFHSNDLRGATTSVNPQDGTALDRVAPLAVARGAEVGVRTQPLPGLTSTLALWTLKLDSELVFQGDQGITTPEGATRRDGVEWSNTWTPAKGWIVDADYAWSRARFIGVPADQAQVPNSIPNSASLGVADEGNGTWFGGLRMRYIGSYPLEESGTYDSTPFWETNLRVGAHLARGFQASLDVLNLFDKHANDIEYWGQTCTRAEGPGCNGGQGIDGRLVHPLEPRTVRLTLQGSF